MSVENKAGGTEIDVTIYRENIDSIFCEKQF